MGFIKITWVHFCRMLMALKNNWLRKYAWNNPLSTYKMTSGLSLIRQKPEGHETSRVYTFALAITDRSVEKWVFSLDNDEGPIYSEGEPGCLSLVRWRNGINSKSWHFRQTNGAPIIMVRGLLISAWMT